ncbi:hypothetical protein [Photobacterium leiognathi]|uniref:hypothetical protein n=1 Tax=Photobacterium leiognathi TaxID=553611 RepID=UPI002981E3A3|nr:hypothetical protein [Photobacterium leiognathi]
MKPYGKPFGRLYCYDVAEVQQMLPSGCRIRNKRNKRRLFKKRTRINAKREIAMHLVSV